MFGCLGSRIDDSQASLRILVDEEMQGKIVDAFTGFDPVD